MRHLLLSFSMCASVAMAQSLTSTYTSLDDKKCKTLEQEGDFIRQSCPGVGKYQLEVTEGDLRQDVRVQFPDGSFSALNLMEQVSYGFSYVGPTAEWLMQKTTPRALILRYNASEDSIDSSKITSYLVVSKITARSACVVGIIKPQKDQNLVARKLAQQAAQKPCLKR